MAGGEKAKSSGEYGEQIVKNILDMMGWNNANSGVTVPCVHKEKHKRENSKESQKHGIDYVYTYKSQLRDATKQRYYEESSENTKRNWISGGIFFNPVSGSEQLHQSDEQHNDCYRL